MKPMSQQTEQAYLASYNIKDYDVCLTSVDSVLFTVIHGELHTLLVRRANHPFLGVWGLPGGFIDVQLDEDLSACANRHLAEKTGVTPPYLEQVASVGNKTRDPRGWSTTVTYYALMAHAHCTTDIDSVDDVQWLPLQQALNMELAFDHKQMIEQALARLQQKALYSLVPVYALPETFTLSELQQLHEVILGKSIQSKSFRRRIELADVLEETGELSQHKGKGKPAALYRVKEGAADYRFMRNLEN